MGEDASEGLEALLFTVLAPKIVELGEVNVTCFEAGGLDVG